MDINVSSQIVVNTAALWSADATVYSAKRILVVSDLFYGATDQRKFKIADGTQTFAQLDFMPLSGFDDATSSIQTQLNGKAGLISPTFTTDITTPIVYGSSASGGVLSLHSTSNATKGSVQIASGGGQVLIGTTTANLGTVGILRVQQSANFMDFGWDGTGNSYMGFWVNKTTPTSSNYAIVANATNILYNAGGASGTHLFTFNGATRYELNNKYVFMLQTASTTGAITNYNLTNSANTGQTASTEIPSFKYNGGSRQWATGAIATQREWYQASTTYTAVAATTITNAYGYYVEAPTASTNITITNNYAFGCSGNVRIIGSITATTYLNTPCEIQLAASDETTALTAGTSKLTFRMPYAMTLTAVRASVTTAATGATLLTVDINESGSSILSTKLTFDASEKTTTTATTPAVISDTALADDAEITIDIDAVGNTIAGAGLKITLIGTRA